jgi:hypothetical protein
MMNELPSLVGRQSEGKAPGLGSTFLRADQWETAPGALIDVLVQMAGIGMNGIVISI